MIIRTKDASEANVPSFFRADQALNVVKIVRYLGHMDDLLYAQTYMLACIFLICTDDAKTALFRAFCTPLHTAYLWCSLVMQK